MNRTTAVAHPSGSRTLVIDTSHNERAPAAVAPRTALRSALADLANKILPSTPDAVRELTKPRERLISFVEFPDDLEQIHMDTISTAGENIAENNIMYAAIEDHLNPDKLDPTERDEKWKEKLSTLLECATMHKLVTELGGDALGDYDVTAKLASAFMKHKVDSVGSRRTQDDKGGVAAAVFATVSRDGISAMWTGLPMAANTGDVFPISEACLHFVRSVLAFLLSTTDAFTQRPYLRVEKVNDALQKRFLKDIDDVTSLIHTLLQGDSPKFIYYIVWKMFHHMGMGFNVDSYPTEQPTLSALNIRSMITSFLVSNVLTLLDESSEGMSREMFDVVALSITKGLMDKSTANELRSGKSKSMSAAGALVITQTSMQLSGAMATMMAVDIDKASQSKVGKVMAPVGMDMQLIMLVANTMQKLSKLKVAHAGSMNDAIQSVLDALVEMNVQTFQHDAMQLTNIALSLRSSVLPFCVARATDPTSCLRDAVLEFTTHMTADSSKVKRDQIQPSLTRYLTMPLAAANALAPKIIKRIQATQAKSEERLATKREREMKALLDQQKEGTLEITPTLAAKFARK